MKALHLLPKQRVAGLLMMSATLFHAIQSFNAAAAASSSSSASFSSTLPPGFPTRPSPELPTEQYFTLPQPVWAATSSTDEGQSGQQSHTESRTAATSTASAAATDNQPKSNNPASLCSASIVDSASSTAPASTSSASSFFSTIPPDLPTRPPPELPTEQYFTLPLPVWAATSSPDSTSSASSSTSTDTTISSSSAAAVTLNRTVITAASQMVNSAIPTTNSLTKSVPWWACILIAVGAVLAVMRFTLLLKRRCDCKSGKRDELNRMEEGRRGKKVRRDTMTAVSTTITTTNSPLPSPTHPNLQPCVTTATTSDAHSTVALSIAYSSAPAFESTTASDGVTIEIVPSAPLTVATIPTAPEQDGNDDTVKCNSV